MRTREDARLELARVGREIAGARARAGLTQAAVAKAAGVAQSNVSELETAKAAVRLDTLAKVASAVGLRLTFEQSAA